MCILVKILYLSQIWMDFNVFRRVLKVYNRATINRLANRQINRLVNFRNLLTANRGPVNLQLGPVRSRLFSG